MFFYLYKHKALFQLEKEKETKRRKMRRISKKFNIKYWLGNTTREENLFNSIVGSKTELKYLIISKRKKLKQSFKNSCS